MALVGERDEITQDRSGSWLRHDGWACTHRRRDVTATDRCCVPERAVGISRLRSRPLPMSLHPHRVALVLADGYGCLTSAGNLLRTPAGRAQARAPRATTGNQTRRGPGDHGRRPDPPPPATRELARCCGLVPGRVDQRGNVRWVTYRGLGMDYPSADAVAGRQTRLALLILRRQRRACLWATSSASGGTRLELGCLRLNAFLGVVSCHHR